MSPHQVEVATRSAHTHHMMLPRRLILNPMKVKVAKKTKVPALMMRRTRRRRKRRGVTIGMKRSLWER